jgi:hypothetical protein
VGWENVKASRPRQAAERIITLFIYTIKMRAGVIRLKAFLFRIGTRGVATPYTARIPFGC